MKSALFKNIRSILTFDIAVRVTGLFDATEHLNFLVLIFRSILY